MSKQHDDPSVRVYDTKVVGVTMANPNGTNRQVIIRRCIPSERLVLLREPTNAYDHNAIKVCRTNGDQIGYISRDIAEWLAPDYMDKGHDVDARVKAVLDAGEEGSTLGCVVTITIAKTKRGAAQTSGAGPATCPDCGKVNAPSTIHCERCGRLL